MTIYDFCELFSDATKVEIFSLDKCKTVFKGYSDEIPKNIGEMDISSIDPVYKESEHITINID